MAEIVPEQYIKNQQKARKKLNSYELSKELAIIKMKAVYGFSPDDDLSLKNKLSLNNLPKLSDLKYPKTAMIFNDEFVYSLMTSKKHLFETKCYFYQKNSNLSNLRRRVCLDIDRYCISFVNEKPYLNIISSNLKYTYNDYLAVDKCITDLYKLEPFDISTNPYIIMNDIYPFDPYRFDNNQEAQIPHLNRLDNGKILTEPQYIYGPHEHQYSELQAVLYQNLPRSYDAHSIWSRRHDMSTTARPPLKKDEVSWLLKTKLNLNIEEKADSDILTDLFEEEYDSSRLYLPSEILETLILPQQERALSL